MMKIGLCTQRLLKSPTRKRSRGVILEDLGHLREIFYPNNFPKILERYVGAPSCCARILFKVSSGMLSINSCKL